MNVRTGYARNKYPIPLDRYLFRAYRRFYDERSGDDV